jgi:formate dehydrogenase
MKIVAVFYPRGKIAKNTPEILGSAENALGLTEFLKEKGLEYIVLTDKEAELDKHISNTDILITTPFWPAYVTKERIFSFKPPTLRLNCLLT